MKAKTLLIAAAALAAGVMTSQAQVYSQNIVGYINVPLNNASGYSLVANQLDLDGTGTNNSIYTTVGTNLPNGTKVEAWNGATFKSSTINNGVWSLNNQVVTNAVNPGSGFFIFYSAPTNITFVGNVITGTNIYNYNYSYDIAAPSGPVTGTIGTALGYVPNNGDVVEVWNGSTFKSHTYSGGAWSGIGGEPVFSTVGQAVFLHPSTTPVSWTQILNVQ
jgi:hypothetical protein